MMLKTLKPKCANLLKQKWKNMMFRCTSQEVSNQDRLKIFESNEEKKLKFSDTLNLPKTKFPARLNAKQKQEVESLIREDLSNLYSWQKSSLLLKEPSFVLHDGPPYANGELHMGHAVNKILKDIILKHKIMNGCKVHYIPGFDCHGLPIELKALNGQEDVCPMEVRAKARKFAKNTIESQSKSFESWGVIGSWNEQSEVYKTFDKCYIKNQIKIFYEMYEKKLIFQDLKPVYWSPSSGSALAEAELEYDNNFSSPSLYLKIKLVNSEIIDGDVNVLIWTTTPWTLPANQGICFNQDLEYYIVNVQNERFLIAGARVNDLRIEFGLDVEIVREIDVQTLNKLKYRHPINRDEILNFISSSHVLADKGTGFVHTAPSHGPEDFLVFLNTKIPLKCLVDEKGCYNSQAPKFLQGKYVLDEGNEQVIKHIENDIFKLGKITHPYPIDWRTKKPVIILASKQWFINTEKIKSEALTEIEKVAILPGKTSKISKKLLKDQLEKRPYWCISRQRSWGVPIPVLYNKENGKPVIDRALIDHWIQLIEEKGSADFWWKKEIAELIPRNYSLDPDKLVKRFDILDIWFDSGISWSYALENDKVADLYLEGVDQFTGWFQSSLMTSVSLRGIAPYKNIFVHGFTVDANGKKMSKSIGNVIDPKTITAKFGTDAMRWFVAAHATQHSLITVADKLIEDSALNIVKLRSTLKYLLGNIRVPTAVCDDFNKRDLNHLDKYILHQLSEFNDDINSSFERFQFNRTVSLVNNFINSNLSSNYLHLIKDRLYCGSEQDYLKLQFVLLKCFQVVCKSIWPITPFLVEECWSYFSENGSFYKNNLKIEKLKFPESMKIVETAMSTKKKFLILTKNHNTMKQNLKIRGCQEILEILQILHPITGAPVYDSELCEIFQVASIHLEISDSSNLEIFLESCEENFCPRCRRFRKINELCGRCLETLKEKNFI